MAVDGILVSLPGAVAGADLSLAQFRFVKLDGATPYSVIVASATGEYAVGVAYSNPSAVGAAVQVVVSGLVKVVAGGAIAIGDPVATNTAGAAVAAVATNIVMGTAMNAAASGEIVEILMVGQRVA